MSIISDLLLIATFGFRLLQTVASVFVRVLVNIPFAIASWTVTFWGALFGLGYQLFSRPRFVVVFVLALTAIFVVGPVGVNDTGLLLKGADIVGETVARPSYEIVSKLGLVSAREAYVTLADIYNTVLTYLIDRGRVFVEDAKDLFSAIAVTGDYFKVLGIPKLLWRFLSTFFGYFWTSKPLFNKLEFILTPADAGFFTETFGPPQPTPPGQVRPEFDPELGAFGIAPPLPGLLFYLRNFLIDIVIIVQKIGDLLFSAVEDLGAPGQRFFPNFIVDVNSRLSYWRRAGDILCRYFSFLSGSSLYPRDATGFQEARFDLEKYMCRIIRLIACVIRYANLLLFDALTVQRAPNVATSEPSVGFQLLLNKLIGVPILDPFLYAFNNPTNPFRTPNILNKNYQQCFTGFKVFAGANSLFTAGLSGGLIPPWIQQTAEECPGIALDTFPSDTNECIKWDGQNPPEEGERVDYFFEFYKCIIDLVQLIEDPEGNIVASSLVVTDAYFEVLEPIIDIITGFVYSANAATFPTTPAAAALGDFQCCSQCADTVLAQNTIPRGLLKIIGFIYRPRTCANAYTQHTRSFVVLSRSCRPGRRLFQHNLHSCCQYAVFRRC